MDSAADLADGALALHDGGNLGGQIGGAGADDMEAQDLVSGLVEHELHQALVLAHGQSRRVYHALVGESNPFGNPTNKTEPFCISLKT